MTDAERIANLEQEIAKMKAKEAPACEPFDAPVDVTACVLAYNDWRRLQEVIPAFWRQDVSLHLMVAMDRASIDPTVAILTWSGLEKYLTTSRAKTICSYKYLGDVPHKPVEEMVAHAKAKFVDACKTEWIFFCDSDVVIPDGGIKKLLAEMKADETIGALGIPYEQQCDHVQMGSILMRTAIAKKTGFTAKGNCVCRNLAERLKEQGLRMTTWASGEMATHLKWRR